jgi:transcriptional regulator
MYLPASFKEERVDVLHDAIRGIAVGTLVTLGSEGLEATHLPLLVDPAPGPFGTLRGHLARANPQWKRADAKVEALVTVLGPNAYVTPSWYPSKRETGKVVPTWNYIAVHAYGTPRFIEDREELRGIVSRLTETHERRRAEPWAVGDAPADYIEAMLKAIVGVELPIARLEGKWKLSQNKAAADIAGIRAGLAQEPGEAAADLVAAMPPAPAGR